MSHQEESRVLARKGARELTIDEIDYVNAAGVFHTNVCTAIMATATVTGKILTPDDQRRLAEETTRQLAA